MMAERGVVVDHATVHRWAINIVPVLAAAFRRRKRPVGSSWRMDETYIKVRGEWKYLYRAVDRDGDTIDYLLRAHRDRAAARRFFERAIDLHGCPRRSRSTRAAPTRRPLRACEPTRAPTSRCASPNTSTTSSNKITGPSSASCIPCSGSSPFAARAFSSPAYETMHMIKKGQLDCLKDQASSAAKKFYSLAF